ncbi:MAG: hypothetical protein M1820_008660 [Bogoriella megaspora]|nr:MAG: hypothetical protein M1820_008660 [Bogoriella megaspora]
MPVITRSKARLVATAQAGNLQFLPTPPKTTKRHSESADPASEQTQTPRDSRYPVNETPRKFQDSSPREAPHDSSGNKVSHKSNKDEPPHDPSGKVYQDSGKKYAFQTFSNKEPHQHSVGKAPQNSSGSGKESLQHSSERESPCVATEPFSPVSIRRITKFHWPCRLCSCAEGVFEELVNNCVQCGHTMDHHEMHLSHPWHHRCDYLCEREELVTSIMQLTNQYGLAVIRATPQVGKSTLLRLLGIHILQNEPNLEPVYIEWKKKATHPTLSFELCLGEQEALWREQNAKLRPGNPNSRTIFLIDEAQSSYEEEGLWSLFKNYRNTRSNPMFVLVCVYGPTGVSRTRDPSVESQAQLIHELHGIELRPSFPGNPCMLFRQEETTQVIQKFAIDAGRQLGDGVVEYIHLSTGGHPGMVGQLISFLNDFYFESGMKIPRTLSVELFHFLMIQRQNSFVDYLARSGRGVWTSRSETYTQDVLLTPQYSHLELLDIKIALREVAMNPNGLVRTQTEDFDAFAFCHKQGLLHTERQILGKNSTTFIFASPLHRRVAYRRLFPGREEDAILQNLSLQQVCINAIARFSPGALQCRQDSQLNKSWGVPEAAFQDELYCCLGLELHYLPILSEYSYKKDGRIDFLVSDQKWGIEVLQSGGSAEITDHAARFSDNGRYKKWGIMEDYIILNFCPRSKLREIKIEDEKVRSHLFHLVIEPDKQAAEIYTHDMQLYKSWSLGEGRQRSDAEEFPDFDPPDDHLDRLLVERKLTTQENHMLGQMSQKVLKIEQQKELSIKETRQQTKAQMEQQNEQEKEDLRRQMEQQNEQEKEDLRRQMEQQNEQEREDLRRQIEQQNEQEKEDMRRQMEQQNEQEKEDMRRQMEQQNEQEKEDLRRQMEDLRQQTRQQNEQQMEGMSHQRRRK